MPTIQLSWLECVESDLPADETWLAEAEVACFRKTWTPNRRRDWILGRWTAKCTVAAHFGLGYDPALFRTLSVLPAETGAPTLWMEGQRMGLALSISHREGRALTFITSQRATVGCDLEKSEPRSRAFVEHLFTPSEIDQVERLNAADHWSHVEALIWSAKESVLKSLAIGLRVDTRYVSIQLHPADTITSWRRFSAMVADGRRFNGWWLHDSPWIRTVASSADSSTPRTLRFSTYDDRAGSDKRSPIRPDGLCAIHEN